MKSQKISQSSNNLITYFIRLFETDWEDQANISMFSTRLTNKNKSDTNKVINVFKDLLRILIVKFISKINAKNQSQFVFSTQLDIKKLETYNLSSNKQKVYFPIVSNNERRTEPKEKKSYVKSH